MVDVNKILGIPDEEKQSLPNQENNLKIKSIDVILPEFNKYLRDFTDVIDIALKRGVTFEQITVDDLNGIKIKYEKDIFSKKVKKFQLKSTMKGLNSIIETYSFNDIYSYIEESYTENLITSNRLLEENSIFIGVDNKSNSVFINFNNDSVYLLLFNLITEDTKLENSLKNKNIVTEVTKDTSEDIDSETNTDLEVEEEHVDSYLESLNNVDDFINKFRK